MITRKQLKERMIKMENKKIKGKGKLKHKFINRWIPYSDKRDWCKYYERKYNAMVFLTSGIESVRKGKIGRNYDFLITWEEDEHFKGCLK